MNPTCESCRWFEPKSYIKDGICRRYPPQFYGDSHSESWWPEVKKGDWCGEFQLPPVKCEKCNVVGWHGEYSGKRLCSQCTTEAMYQNVINKRTAVE
jgi:hypothetical protein